MLASRFRQHDDRALDYPFGARVSLLVKLEAALQRLVGNLLHPDIHRRVNLDTSLQKIFNAAGPRPGL